MIVVWMAFFRRMETYRDFGFFVDLARALAVFVGAEDLQRLLAREREARREVTYDARDAREGKGCRVSIVFVDFVESSAPKTSRKAFERAEGKMSTYRRWRGRTREQGRPSCLKEGGVLK